MKLLLDQNLSFRLVALLSDVFPSSAHVRDFSLDAAEDETIYDFTRDNDFVVVTNDEDYSDLVTLRGYPPKIVWLRVGNCTTAQVEQYLRDHQSQIALLVSDADLGVLQIVP